MDSALCLQYGALCVPSPMRVTRVSRLLPNFNNPSPLSLSSLCSTHRAVSGHAFSPVISALNKPSTPSANDKDDKKFFVRGIGGASVVLACVLGIMNCNYKFTPRAIAGVRDPPYQTSRSSVKQDISYPKSAKDVLQSLLMVNQNVASSKNSILPNLNNLKSPPEPSMEDCERLKIQAAALIKDGKSDRAERQLQDIYNNMVTGGKTEPAYNVQMALVAILIFQGKYQEALKWVCLNKEHAIPSDGRVHLYKAIIYTMLEENKEAKECWETFIGFLDNEGVPNPSSPSHGSKHKQHSGRFKI
ncbi:hypothetical protein ACE6H2_013563 [Prunus campanulata]